jgi:Ca2+-transporting ATPase
MIFVSIHPAACCYIRFEQQQSIMNASDPTMREMPGLSSADVLALQRKYGLNVFRGSGSRLFSTVVDIVKEPMFILLVIASTLYFILGSIAEGVLMVVAIALVTAISIFQETRSARALKTLRQYMEPKVKVIRDSKEVYIDSRNLFPGDIILLEEGMKVPADAFVIAANDLTTDDSIITGESMPVEKTAEAARRFLYQGTTLTTGKCVAIVHATGNNTELGRIGKSIEGYGGTKTLLQMQVNRFVKRFAFFGFAGFIIILVVNYLHYQQIATSLLFALTVAMSVIPEEIPVAFSSFMALGAYKMGKAGIISRQPQVIENLGAMNILCLDKTGTLTENKMQVQSIYRYHTDTLIEADALAPNEELLWYAVLASEINPFDPMEKAIWEAWVKVQSETRVSKWDIVKEYPLEGRPPMMTHVHRSGNKLLAATKGGAETVLNACKLSPEEKIKITGRIKTLGSRGYRVLGVAIAAHSEDTFPKNQQEFNWQFIGLLALYDPPRKNAAAVLKKIYDAGIQVKLVTGDYPETAITIAQQTGILNPLKYRTGEEVMEMKEDALITAASVTTVFARMFPEAKLKLINALKSTGNIVAMTGDGVNDGPALKAADIGIAMGKKGTETARRASDLVLSDDNLANIATAVGEGRKIFANLVKAIRYIIAIHIPIILTASIPLLLGWKYPNIFSPVHVIFLELIMAPTCSIFYEREPVETSVMQSKPRSRTAGLFTAEEFLLAVVQGLLITAAVLSLYVIFMNKGYSIEETRTIVFTTLLVSNLFLTFTNRSLTQTMYYTLRYKNNLAIVVFLASVAFLLVLHVVAPVQQLFEMAPVSSPVFWLCFTMAFCSVMWFEVYKSGLRKLMEKL